MLDHGPIHQGHEKRNPWRQHVHRATRPRSYAIDKVWQEVTSSCLGNGRSDSRYKQYGGVQSIICYLCFMQHAWSCFFPIRPLVYIRLIYIKLSFFAIKLCEGMPQRYVFAEKLASGGGGVGGRETTLSVFRTSVARNQFRLHFTILWVTWWKWACVGLSILFAFTARMWQIAATLWEETWRTKISPIYIVLYQFPLFSPISSISK